jgi:acetolactate synthase-1/2/3 large subunit
MFPRETLTQTWDEAAMRPFPQERYGAVSAGAAGAAAVAQIADKLLSAKHPVMVASYAGRNLEAPALIEEVARTAGIRVFEANPLYLNISRASPCFAGMMAAIAEADVGLLVDVDVPWIPKDTKENPQTWWAHIDVDVVKECFPIWGFASNARVQGDSVLILRQLLEALRAKATPAFREAAAKRVEAMRGEGNERRAGLAKQAADKGKSGAVNPHYLCSEISKTIGDDAIVVNEGIRNGPIVNNQIMRTRPGSSIGFAGGGLGSSSGTALGIKLAKPDATVVQMVGDGGFYFGNPSSVYAVSKQYKLPIFTVLFDNSGWSAVKEATLRVYPEGDAKATNQFNALLAPDIEFTKICEAAGGYGERVDDPDAVPAAIQRCLKEVRGGQRRRGRRRCSLRKPYAMPRLACPEEPRVALHVVQRGRARSACFSCAGDRAAYLKALRACSEVEQCAVHAYALMGNHVHLLMTFTRAAGAARLMPAVAARYARHLARAYGHEERVWEEAYDASPVRARRHLLACMRYIEREG